MIFFNTELKNKGERDKEIMLEFSEDLFKEENRCGFVVCEKMKRVWAAELEVLTEVIRICKKYHLMYYADWGTLLGGVRHKGYIPWDDDIDIALKRKDYIKLFEVLPYELPEFYDVKSIYTSTEHKEPLGCVINGKTFHTDPEIIRQFHGCRYIVGIDIAPLDFIPREEEMAFVQRELYNVVYDAAYRFDELTETGEIELYLPRIEELCKTTIDKSKSLRNQLWRLSERISTLYTEEECDYLTWFPYTVTTKPDFKLKKEWYDNIIEVPFENIKIAIPEHYHEVLTEMFGDYQIFKKGTSFHNYPFYQKQEKYLKVLQS